jgi:hypothetical protein
MRRTGTNLEPLSSETKCDLVRSARTERPRFSETAPALRSYRSPRPWVPPGLIVVDQQRLSALALLTSKSFQVFVFRHPMSRTKRMGRRSEKGETEILDRVATRWRLAHLYYERHDGGLTKCSHFFKRLHWLRGLATAATIDFRPWR